MKKVFARLVFAILVMVTLLGLSLAVDSKAKSPWVETSVNSQTSEDYPIQGFIDAAIEVGGGEVTIPPGFYDYSGLDNPLIIDKSQLGHYNQLVIKGYGVTIKYDHDDPDSYLFTFVDRPPGYPHVGRIVLKGFELNGWGSAANPIKVDGVNWVTVEDLNIRGFPEAKMFYLTGEADGSTWSEGFKIEDVYLNGGLVGVYCDAAASGFTVDGLVIDAYGDDAIGIYLSKSNGGRGTFAGGSIKRFAMGGIIGSDMVGIELDYHVGGLIIGPWDFGMRIENQDGVAFKIGENMIGAPAIMPGYLHGTGLPELIDNPFNKEIIWIP